MISPRRSFGGVQVVKLASSNQQHRLAARAGTRPRVHHPDGVATRILNAEWRAIFDKRAPGGGARIAAMRIKLNSIMVDDQDKALRFYTEALGFAIFADTCGNLIQLYQPA